MKRLIPLFLLAGLTLMPTALEAKPPLKYGFERLEARKGRLIEELNLSFAQQQQLEAIRQQRQLEMQSLKQRVRDLRQEMEQLMASNASQDQLRSKFQQVQALKNQIAEARFEQMLAMREVLTPEQRAKFNELMLQRRFPKRP